MFELQKPPLYVSRARHLSACLFYVSASGAIIAAATANSRRLSQQNPYKTCVSLVELGLTSRHFIVHFEKIPTKKFPGIGVVPMPLPNRKRMGGVIMFFRPESQISQNIQKHGFFVVFFFGGIVGFLNTEISQKNTKTQTSGVKKNVNNGSGGA